MRNPAISKNFKFAGLIPFLVWCLAPVPVLAAKADPLAAFEPFIGKTWRGLSTNPETPQQTDVQEWKAILGGSAIQVTHSIDAGVYGGITIIFVEPESKKIIYHYFTTAGFITIGEYQTTPTGWTAEEQVEGHPDITKVRSSGSFQPDGSFVVSNEYYSDGNWKNAYGFDYVQDDKSQVLFRAFAN